MLCAGPARPGLQSSRTTVRASVREETMSGDDVREFFENVVEIVLYSAVAVALALVVFEVASRRFDLIREIREENNVAAGVLGGAFVLGIFYTVAQIVVA
jgi:hypothetical protein